MFIHNVYVSGHIPHISIKFISISIIFLMNMSGILLPMKLIHL